MPNVAIMTPTDSPVGGVNRSPIGALPKAIHEMAVEDAQAYRSTQELRNVFIGALRAQGKSTASFDEDKDPAFVKEMRKISRDSLGIKSSDKGLTVAEKLELKDGCYQIAPLIDPEVKPSGLPAFMTEAKRIKADSIRKYWQQQTNSWYRSVQSSMALYERQVELVSNPNARTAQHVERQAKQINGVIKRERACEGDTQVLLARELTYLVKISQRLSKEHGTEKLPE